MAQHMLMADLGALLLVLGLTGPLLQPVLAHAGRAPAARARPPGGGVLAVGGRPVRLALAGALPGRPRPPARCTRCSTRSFVFFGFTMWLALLGPLPQPSWFGNGAKLLYIVAVRLTGALLGNIFIWSGSVFYPDYRPGEASWDLIAAAGPGRGGHDHDDREQHRHRSTARMAVREDRARVARSARSCWSWPARAGWSWTSGERPGRVASGRGDELRRRLERGLMRAAIALVARVAGLAGCAARRTGPVARGRGALARGRDDPRLADGRRRTATSAGRPRSSPPVRSSTRAGPFRLPNSAAARIFNEGLPCHADLIALEDEGAKVLATFRLRAGPGGPCDGGSRCATRSSTASSPSGASYRGAADADPLGPAV